MNITAFSRAISLIALGLTGSMPSGNAADSGTASGNSSEAAAPAAAVYVDSRIGRDTNPGTKESPVHSIARAAEVVRSRDNAIYVIKLFPGIHVLDKHIPLATEKEMAGQRIVVEACTLPDDPAWTPDMMPIVINSSDLGAFSAEAYRFVVSFLVDESHVTIRGLKFHGYFRPDSLYFPIGRANKAKTDPRVEQCMFVGDPDAAHIQVAVLAHGNEIKVDHCVFYHVNNAVVFWEDAGDRIKSGNALTHSIIVGAGESAVWTSWPDKDLVFKNNIVAQCKRAWVKNAANTARYSMQDCVVVNNQFHTTVAYEDGVRPEPFDLGESNVVKTGEVVLRLVTDREKPLPRDYLHPLPGSLGHDLNAGLFKE